MTHTKTRREGRRSPLTRANLTDGERRHLAACVHEAGHSVVCAMLGGEIRTEGEIIQEKKRSELRQERDAEVIPS